MHVNIVGDGLEVSVALNIDVVKRMKVCVCVDCQDNYEFYCRHCWIYRENCRNYDCEYCDDCD